MFVCLSVALKVVATSECLCKSSKSDRIFRGNVNESVHYMQTIGAVNGNIYTRLDMEGRTLRDLQGKFLILLAFKPCFSFYT